VVADYVALSVMGRGVTKALTIRDETFNYYAALQAKKNMLKVSALACANLFQKSLL